MISFIYQPVIPCFTQNAELIFCIMEILFNRFMVDGYLTEHLSLTLILFCFQVMSRVT
jgi:hypothetical protein